MGTPGTVLLPDPYWPSLPRLRSERVDPVLLTAVVPTHRCGAVPDSHRVPSCLPTPGWRREPAASTTICSGRSKMWDHMLCRRVSARFRLSEPPSRAGDRGSPGRSARARRAARRRRRAVHDRGLAVEPVHGAPFGDAKVDRGVRGGIRGMPLPYPLMRVHRINAVTAVIAVTATAGVLASTSQATAHPRSQRIEATISDKVVDEGCPPPTQVCVVGTVRGKHGFNGTTVFVLGSRGEAPRRHLTNARSVGRSPTPSRTGRPSRRSRRASATSTPTPAPVTQAAPSSSPAALAATKVRPATPTSPSTSRTTTSSPRFEGEVSLAKN